MMMARGRPGRGAFSLIEILIVLVMISLLAGIALPSWRTHQHQAVLREAKWVLLLLALNTMALIGPYHLALADWHAARDIVAQAPDIQSEDNEK